MKKHLFAVCAYGESPFLEACIRSVVHQGEDSGVILSTSTPNEYIANICKKYDIQMFVNDGENGITQDWNFAYSKADAEYVTIAHQDDVYCKGYAATVVRMLDNSMKPILFSSNYAELRNGLIESNNKLLKIKRVMMLPLRMRGLQNSKFVRRRILSLGSPICCPSVTFVKKNCPDVVFQHGFRADEDWQAWEYLSRRDEAFVYSKNILMYHRIHEGSETSKILEDNARHKEDYVMFCKFWPRPIARFLTKVYGASEKSNDL